MASDPGSDALLDRAADRRRDSAWLDARLADPATRLIPLWRGRALIAEHDGLPTAVRPRLAELPWLVEQAEHLLFLGLCDGEAYFAAELPGEDEALPARPDLAACGRFTELIQVGALLTARDAALLLHARGLAHWHGTLRHCGRCGAETVMREAGHLRVCSACATEHHPRTDPAIIVLVHHGDHCLLGRQPRWPRGMVSTLAGFVEPGESLEDTVRREVMEEAGVLVRHPRYYASQPWPFPASLMLGFHAEAAAMSDPVVDGQELEFAAWFSKTDIARFRDLGFSLPGPFSIARRLIDAWLAGKSAP